MSTRHALACALAALTLALAACGSPSTDAAPTTAPAPLTTPDGVATAFADVYAAGDTPTACTFAGGYALQHMTELGQCGHTQWPAIQYWPGQVCTFPAKDPAGLAQYDSLRVFQFHTDGKVNGFPDFLVGVQPSGTSWRVTSILPDTAAQAGMAATCAAAAVGNPTTGPGE